MLSIRNRHYELESRQPLPWGDPYIVQLFTVNGSTSEEQANRWHIGHYARLRLEAAPPLGDPSPDFDVPQRRSSILPGDEVTDDE